MSSVLILTLALVTVAGLGAGIAVSFIRAAAAGHDTGNLALRVEQLEKQVSTNGGPCTCKCTAGYEGKNCSINTDDCLPNPCKNSGTCTDGVDTFTCKCTAGYEGEDCSINTDDCSSNPCKNGGTCTDGVDAYTCKCTAGYEGEDCSTNIDDCSSNPCNNGGSCTDSVDAYTCKCADGYEGDECSINTDEIMKSDYGAVLKVLGAGEDSVNGFYKANGEDLASRPLYLKVRQGKCERGRLMLSPLMAPDRFARQ